MDSGPRWSVTHTQEVSVTTYRAVMAAEAPSSMLATAMMLLIRHSPMYTICAAVPTYN